SAFCLGMADREKVLGDAGDSAPRRWQWADIDRPDRADNADGVAIDAVLFIYGKSPQECEAVLACHQKKLGVKAKWTLTTQPTDKTMEERRRLVKEADEAAPEAEK